MIEIRMPGRFDGYFSGTGVGQGQVEEGNKAERLAYEAYVKAEQRRSGSGYHLVITIDVPREDVAAVLDVFLDHASACAHLNAHDEEGSASEARAARTFVERLGAVYTKLSAEMPTWRQKMFWDAGLQPPRAA
uniref:hypothetical protein n=1 Tax=Nonomuraea sp. CA-251285 TaxID=3240002 RepID=UPI003F49281C